MPWGKALGRWVQQQAASGNAPVFAGSGTTSVANAAFANATAAHGLELDDTHDESITHPGAPVIACALADGFAQGRAPDEVLAAIIAGYEVTGRVGAATGAADVVHNGFHPTSLFAGFGALATIANLRGLSATQLMRGWGLVLSMAGGSMQFSQEATGTTIKRLHGGLAALHAVLAADLVTLGVEGPENALAGRYGLLRLFGQTIDSARLVQRHSEAPEIHRVSFKLYPCCRFFHSTLDALADVTKQFSIEPDRIRRYTVGGPDVLSTQHVVRRPESEMAAQYSLPFALGAATVFGPRSVAGFTEAALTDRRILDIADRVDVVCDEQLQKRFPAHFGSWLEIELEDGPTRRSEVLDSIGTPANPASLDMLVKKFDELVAPVASHLSGERISQDVLTLRGAGSLRRLVSRFAPA